MIKALLIYHIKSNLKLFIIFLGILMMYLSMIIAMYDPESADVMQAMLQMLPEALVRAMHFSEIDATFVGFIGSYYYGFLVLGFPMVYEILVGNKLVVKGIDDGSFAFIASTPHKRSRWMMTNIVFYITSIFLLILTIFLLGLVMSSAMFPGALDIKAFALMNLGALLMHLLIGSIVYAASAIFNTTKNAITYGTGLLIFFFLLHMISNVGEQVSFLGYFTIFSLFDTTQIITYDPAMWISFAIMAGGSATLFVGSSLYFIRKDLPL